MVSLGLLKPQMDTDETQIQNSAFEFICVDLWLNQSESGRGAQTRKSMFRYRRENDSEIGSGRARRLQNRVRRR